jgi:ankyrin repeat protein
MRYRKSELGVIAALATFALTADPSVSASAVGAGSSQTPSAAAAKSPPVNNRRVSPLLEAVGSADQARVAALLESGVKPDEPKDGRSALVQAVTSFDGQRLYCNVGIVKLLVAHGADPNRADPVIGARPLHTALEVGDSECARIVKNAGGRIDLYDDRGHTVLTAAAAAASRGGNVGLVDLVLGWGVDPSARDRDGSTALHQAVWDNSAHLVRQLLARGADTCLQNRFGQTPLEMAKNLHRSKELIELLVPVSGCVTHNQLQ